MGRAKRLLLRVILVALLLSVALAIAIIALLNTESGTRWTVSKAAAALPGDIVLENISGTLWKETHIAEVRYDDGKQRIRIAKLSVQIDWPSVLAKQLAIRDFTVSSIRVENLLPSAPPTPLSVSIPASPVVVSLSRGRVDELMLVSGQSEQLLQDINLTGVRYDTDNLSLESATVSVAGIHIVIEDASTRFAGDVPVTASVAWNLNESDWSGRGHLTGTLQALVVTQDVSGPYPATIAATVSLLERIEPEFDATINWLEWTAENNQLRNGTLRIQGTTANYLAQLEGELLANGEVDVHLVGDAEGNLDGLRMLTLAADSVEGSAQIDGTVMWAPRRSVDITAAISKLDPQLLHKDLAGVIDASAAIKLGDDNVLHLEQLVATGELNGARVVGNGRVTLSDTHKTCVDCRLRVGDNDIEIQGGLHDETLHLDYKVAAPNLTQFWPALQGTLNIDGELTGHVESPSIALTADASALIVNDQAVGDGQVSLQGKSSDAKVNVTWVNQGVTITADGTFAVLHQTVKGTVDTASISEATAGRWTLTEPLSFSRSGAALEVTAHEWLGDNGSLIVKHLTMTETQGHIAAALRRLPLPLANSALPANVRLSGFANVDVDVRFDQGRWSGPLRLWQEDTELTVVDQFNETTIIKVLVVETDINLVNGGLDGMARVEFQTGAVGSLAVTLQALNATAPMTAELKIDGDDWTWVSALVPDIDLFEGRLSAVVNASGPLDAPDFAGDVEWHDGKIAIPALNVPLSNINVVISGASDGEATVAGSATAGDGSISIDGRASDVMTQDRSLFLDLKGDTAEIINWPEYRIWASPDVRLTGDASGWRVSGAVALPKAEIAIQKAPVDAITESPDVIVLGEERAADEPLRIDGDVQVSLGNAVHFNALGLDTKLIGDVRLVAKKSGQVSANGKLRLVDGTFIAQGQRLTIDQGSLTFTGPLDNPIVDVRAVRVIDTFDANVTVGINLRGRAQNLVSSVFSEPAMGDADALSYLILGRPLSQASDSEGGELTGAAAALGLRQATRITEQIGQTLGLDQLSLAGDGSDTTALIAGKQINTRLYARYAYGVFSRLGTLLLRYRLSKRMTLEAGAGENQSIDVLYSVEK